MGGPRTCISNKFPGNVDAAGRNGFEKHSFRVNFAHWKACSMSLNKSPFFGLRLSLFCALGWGMARLSYFISKFPMSPALSAFLPHPPDLPAGSLCPSGWGVTRSLQPPSGVMSRADSSVLSPPFIPIHLVSSLKNHFVFCLFVCFKIFDC